METEKVKNLIIAAAPTAFSAIFAAVAIGIQMGYKTPCNESTINTQSTISGLLAGFLAVIAVAGWIEYRRKFGQFSGFVEDIQAIIEVASIIKHPEKVKALEEEDIPLYKRILEESEPDADTIHFLRAISYAEMVIKKIKEIPEKIFEKISDPEKEFNTGGKHER